MNMHKQEGSFGTRSVLGLFVFGLVVQAGCVCMQLQSQDGDQKDIAFGKMQYWKHWLSSDEDLAFY